jgi:hypothetical protein
MLNNRNARLYASDKHKLQIQHGHTLICTPIVADTLHFMKGDCGQTVFLQLNPQRKSNYAI